MNETHFHGFVHRNLRTSRLHEFNYDISIFVMLPMKYSNIIFTRIYYNLQDVTDNLFNN